MEALYFGSGSPGGSGSGPWIMADMENGLFSGGSTAANTEDQSIPDRFVHAVVKGESNHWDIMGGNAASGTLSTFYSGVRPAGYNPMLKEGSIILGIGGDNSDSAQGTFYEGAMTTGYPSDATDDSVQTDIVAAGYAVTSLVSGPAFAVGSTISLKATTDCCTAYYIAHEGSTVILEDVTSSSPIAIQQQASWTVVTGLGNSGCYSFESVDTPGSYIRHSNYELYLDATDGSALFETDATFCPETGLNGEGTSIRSWSYPTNYFRHYDYLLYIASNGGPDDYDSTITYNNDTTFIVGVGFAS
jgi:hypothetical protein